MEHSACASCGDLQQQLERERSQHATILEELRQERALPKHAANDSAGGLDKGSFWMSYTPWILVRDAA